MSKVLYDEHGTPYHVHSPPQQRQPRAKMGCGDALLIIAGVPLLAGAVMSGHHLLACGVGLVIIARFLLFRAYQ